jgi:hypothetical protein
MSKKTIPALKPYLETVRNHCRKLSASELQDIICELAQEVLPDKRADFLEKLRSGSRSMVRPHDEADNALISKITSLKDEILERQESIEDGSYYDEYGYDEEYDEEYPESLSAEQKKALEALFLESDHLFLSGDLKTAQKAYQSLLSLFSGSQTDDEILYEISHRDVTLNWRETRARYCRCVYETSAPEEKISRMLDAMEIDALMFEKRYTPSEESYPMLQDVSDAAPGELADFKNFLKDWKKALQSEKGNRAYTLLLEAILLNEGMDSVAAEVKKRRMPVGYVFWLDKLVSEGKWEDAAIIAQAELENIPDGGLRAQAAEILSAAGKEIGNNPLVLKGVREQFRSLPNEAVLAMLIDHAKEQNAKHAELENALRVLESKNSDTYRLRVKILLMLGRLEEAFQIADKSKPLGWSYDRSGIGLVFSGILTALTHADSGAVTVQTLFRRYNSAEYEYLDYSSHSETPAWKQEEKSHDQLIFQEMLQGLRGISLSDSEKQKWFELAKKIGESRIDAIVSEKHRGAYHRAAEVLGALTEYLLMNRQTASAKSLLAMYKDEKYKRHSAFRREVDTVLKNSAVLKKL